MSDIFISYIHEEERAAQAVQRFLKIHLGPDQQVFLASDTWQIYAGEVWLDRIMQELESARVVILLLSPESVKRPWVNFEAGAALAMKKIVLPACLGGLSKGEMPKPYSNLQGLDLSREPYYLIQSVFHHLKLSGLLPVPFLPDDESVKVLQEALCANTDR